MKFKKHLITEMVYPGNIGFQEMVEFYQTASKQQIKQMEKIIKASEWKKFKKLIKTVIGKDLV